VNFDYIKEIQVKTGGYEPEFGEAMGGFVNVVTKSGGNQIEGSAFGYLQSEELERSHVRSDLVVPTSDIVSTQIQDFGVELGGPIVTDKAFWYVAVDPTFIKETRRTSAAVTEAQGFDHTLASERTIYNYAGNVKWSVNPRHTLTVSAFGDPGIGPMGPQRPGLFGDGALIVENPVSRFTEIEFGGHNAVARWEAQLTNSWLAEASIAYHRDKFNETLALSQPKGTDFRTGFIDYGGVGFGHNSESRNLQYKIKFSNFLDGMGQHNFRYGVEYQDIGYDNTTNYSGEPIEFMDSSGNTLMSSTGFIWQLTPPDMSGNSEFQITRIRTGPKTADTSSDYTSFFVSDTWSPTDYLNIMAGVRYERAKLKGNLSSFTWGNNWAPRAHITFDPTRDNKSKLSFAYGRFYGKIPNQIAVRLLSSEVTHFLGYDPANVDLSDLNNPRPTGPALYDVTFGDEPTEIDPDAKLTYQDEYVVNAEREILPFFKVGVSYTHRRLGRALEDVANVPYSTTVARDTFGVYFITNPTPEDGFPKPSRKYNAVTFKLDKRWYEKWQAIGSYTWSRLKGNYEGYYRRDNDQPDPLLTSMFDFPYLEDPEIFKYIIEDGLLPNDRTHAVNLYGSYGFDFNLNVGLGVRVQSGVPKTRMGYHIPYSTSSEIPLEERGASGRTPMTGDIGLHLDYSFLLTGANRLEVILDVFNLLNHRKGLSSDNAWELSGPLEVPPTLDPNDVTLGKANPDFGKPLSFQNPRQIRLAVRSRF
jgi:hypothetical protein